MGHREARHGHGHLSDCIPIFFSWKVVSNIKGSKHKYLMAIIWNVFIFTRICVFYSLCFVIHVNGITMNRGSFRCDLLTHAYWL